MVINLAFFMYFNVKILAFMIIVGLLKVFYFLNKHYYWKIVYHKCTDENQICELFLFKIFH